VRWVLLDLLICLIALGFLGAVALGLWRKVKALSAEVGRAGDAVGRATDALAQVQAEQPISRRVDGPDTGGRRA
jgi:hypothetical protein